MFMAGMLALCGLPLSGVFRSEFQIVAGGLASGNYAAAAALVVLVTVAFFGLATSATSMLLTSPPQPPRSGARQAAQARSRVDDGGRARAAVITAQTPAQEQVPARGEPSVWMVVPVLAGVAVLLVLGVHPPGEITGLITRAAAQLGGTP
jgi:hydrogenase-4 component F